MSTDYRLIRNIFACDLFDGRLEAFGIREHQAAKTTENQKCLTDGRNNYLWVYINEQAMVACLSRYAPNGAPDQAPISKRTRFPFLEGWEG
jgi:hypothetical protein